MGGVNLSIIYQTYRNSRMLRRQLLVWKHEWPPSVKGDVELVLVDDCSPEPAIDVLNEMWGGSRDGLPALSLYRILVDKPWNQAGARNLGCHVARGRWLFCSDIDHVIPASTLAEVLRLLPTLGRNDVLTFGRRDAPQTLTWKAEHWPEFALTKRPDGSLKAHPNSYVVRRKRYWELGGGDEEFEGYGTDAQMRRKLHGPGSVSHHLDHAPLIRVGRDVIPDASTTTYSRETQRCNVKAVLARKRREGRAGKTTVLNFPWQQVAL